MIAEVLFACAAGLVGLSDAQQYAEEMNAHYLKNEHKKVYGLYLKIRDAALKADLDAHEDSISLARRYRFAARMRKFAVRYGFVDDAAVLRSRQDLIVSAYAASRGRADGSAEQALAALVASLPGMPDIADKTRPVVAIVPAPVELEEEAGVFTVWGQDVSERLAVCVEDAALPAEGYALRITGEGIEIRSSTAAGRFYAVQTLKQLVRIDVDDTLTFPCLQIRDHPRFAWRGVMLDESRHFFGKGVVKRLIDVVSSYKFNVFHWHLTDNQGWRLPVGKHPDVGVRCSTRPASRNQCDIRDAVEDCNYGPFCYTERDIREVVAYAAERNVRIVPEIDVPGHSAALLKGFPELGCGGAVDDVLCIGNAETRAFLDDVFDSVTDLFPGEVVHIGCDEVNKAGWKNCRKCQTFMKEKGLADEKALQAWTVSHVAARLAAKGRRIVGWDEMAFDGEIPAGGIVMEWQDGRHGGAVAVRRGHQCVLTPWSYSYFIGEQMLRDGDPFYYNGPQWYGPSLSLEKAYSYDPLAKIPKDRAHLVLGGQCCNWTETTVCEAELQWKMWPRALATAEIYWSAVSRRDFDNFRRRVELHRPRLFKMHVNCAPVE